MDKTFEFNGKEYTAEIDYTIDGKYYPATRHEPAEYPEIIWNASAFFDEDGARVLHPDLIRKLEAKLMEKADEIDDEIADIEGSRADYAYRERDGFECESHWGGARDW